MKPVSQMILAACIAFTALNPPSAVENADTKSLLKRAEQSVLPTDPDDLKAEAESLQKLALTQQARLRDLASYIARDRLRETATRFVENGGYSPSQVVATVEVKDDIGFGTTYAVIVRSGMFDEYIAEVDGFGGWSETRFGSQFWAKSSGFSLQAIDKLGYSKSISEAHLDWETEQRVLRAAGR